jgi:hypothetical protein
VVDGAKKLCRASSGVSPTSPGAWATPLIRATKKTKNLIVYIEKKNLVYMKEKKISVHYYYFFNWYKKKKKKATDQSNGSKNKPTDQ